MDRNDADENSIDERYSRLTALENMGVVDDYSLIMKKTIFVIGVGGVGSVVVEMLTRCGVGKLIIVDFDIVELSNMNRMFYNMNHIGMYKTDACVDTLKLINPKINIEKYNINIVEDYSIFYNIFKTKKIDLLVSCVDNYSARSIISQVCNEFDLVWFESGISENAISGHIQFVIPGMTACYCCAPPLVNFESNFSEDKINSIVMNSENENNSKKLSSRTCAASLSTTTSVIAGILVNNILKYFLGFGENSNFLGYHMIDDYFPRYSIIPNKECIDKWCRLRQKEKEYNKNEKTKNKSPYKEEPSRSNVSNGELLENYSNFEVIESDIHMESSKNLLESLNNLSISELINKLDEVSSK
ncbi:ThiF/moeB-like protein [Cryptosporidium parvum]|uniref:Ubiquitin-like modifier-activating enzyme 5 n=2 Tax=Cryptosporidium parvum TaxID=5807 RepID=A0A7S7LHU8_CRYPV|nr:THIF-type NAD/FAD binding fold containing protein [Cryptosporidium parvum]WKS77548.1 ThiF/moeB-like protein [Cryptosporidium sp. 43IA8]WRK31777.1 THIF-type NAD/FAD binding fold containing protein [Cryptosporidium parvum]|eukprot:QOY42248.1 hypothetical protein CPATCC_001871 [Cryptosporidium parvum]